MSTRQAIDWTWRHSSGRLPGSKYTCCMYKKTQELPNEFNRSSSCLHLECLAPARGRTGNNTDRRRRTIWRST